MQLNKPCKQPDCDRRTQLPSGYCVVHNIMEAVIAETSKRVDQSYARKEHKPKPHDWRVSLDVPLLCKDCGCEITAGLNGKRKRCKSCAKAWRLHIAAMVYEEKKNRRLKI